MKNVKQLDLSMEGLEDYVVNLATDDVKNYVVKDYYKRILNLIQNRQKELGITNKQMALWLDIKESNYVRLVEGKCHMDTLRLIQIVIELELDMCFMKPQTLIVDHVS